MSEIKTEAERVAYDELHGCMIRRSGDTCEVRKEFLAVALKTLSLQDELVEALEGLADVLEHDCDCPPCIGSMAPGEHYLGLARSLLTRIKSERDGI